MQHSLDAQEDKYHLNVRLHREADFPLVVRPREEKPIEIIVHGLHEARHEDFEIRVSPRVPLAGFDLNIRRRV